MDRPEQADRRPVERLEGKEVAGSTGLEPAASGVTGRRSNQLNYDPKLCTAALRPHPASLCD